MKNTTTPKTHYTALFDSFIESELININDKAVFMAIKKHMNKDTFECYPSVDTICQCARLSKPTVLKSIENLESLGVLKVKRQRRKGNLYTVIDSFEIWLAETIEELKKIADKAYIEFLKAREIISKSVKVKRNAVEPMEQVEPEAVEPEEQPKKEQPQEEESIYNSCDFNGFSKAEQKKLIILAESKGMSIEKFTTYLDYMRNQRTKNKISNPTAYMNKLESEGVVLGLYRADGERGAVGAVAKTYTKRNAFCDFPQRTDNYTKKDWDDLEIMLANTPLF